MLKKRKNIGIDLIILDDILDKIRELASMYKRNYMEDHETPTKKAADPRKMTVNLFVHHKYSALYIFLGHNWRYVLLSKIGKRYNKR